MSRTTHLAAGSGWSPAPPLASALLVLPAAPATTRTSRRRQHGGSDSQRRGSDNDDPGEKVTIGFSGPAADHGWLAAINSTA